MLPDYSGRTTFSPQSSLSWDGGENEVGVDATK